MAKKNEKKFNTNNTEIPQAKNTAELAINHDTKVDLNNEQTKQAVQSEQHFTEQLNEQNVNNDDAESLSPLLEKSTSMDNNKTKKSSSGKGIALLALLVALGIGGTGYYFGTQKLTAIEQQIASLNQQAYQTTVRELPNFDQEKAQIASLSTDYQKSQERISQLEREQAIYAQQINNLQLQLNKLGTSVNTESSTWLLSDANFLLNNALRKMVLDNDIDTTISLLEEADKVLSRVSDPQILTVRQAIRADLAQLDNVNDVNQNAIMQSLSTLANGIDDLTLIDSDNTNEENNTVSNSFADWKENLQKSAISFLDHFIRISDRNPTDKVLISPNQEIYLRENIRLRLQIAILTVPRQQYELYKQSIEIVAAWIRSYFDIQDPNVKHFLQELDDLAEKSIYIDAPTKLQSLILLDEVLHKQPKPIKKIELKVEKAFTDSTQPEAKTNSIEKSAEVINPKTESADEKSPVTIEAK